MEGENQSPSEGEPKEIDIKDVKEYFQKQPTADEAGLSEVSNRALEGNFFDKVKIAKNHEASPYDLALEDVKNSKDLEEKYRQEGRNEIAEQYKTSGDEAERVVDFLKKLNPDKLNEASNPVHPNVMEGVREAATEILGRDITQEKNIADALVPQSIDVGLESSDKRFKAESVETPLQAKMPESLEELVKPGDVDKNESQAEIEEALSLREQMAKIAEQKEKQKIENIIEVEKQPEKKEREYDKLGRQIAEFKTLWADDKEKEIIELAKEMASGKEVEDKEKAKEIYKKKSGLYGTATKIIKSKEIRQQLKEIADIAKKAGEYKKGKKIIKIKEGEKIDGRLFFKNDKYYFEFGGKLFLVEQKKKLTSKKGRPPSPTAPIDTLQVGDPEVASVGAQKQQPIEATKAEQSQVLASEPAEPVVDGLKEEIDELRAARILTKEEQNRLQVGAIDTPAESLAQTISEPVVEIATIEVPKPQRLEALSSYAEKLAEIAIKNLGINSKWIENNPEISVELTPEEVANLDKTFKYVGEYFIKQELLSADLKENLGKKRGYMENVGETMREGLTKRFTSMISIGNDWGITGNLCARLIINKEQPKNIFENMRDLASIRNGDVEKFVRPFADLFPSIKEELDLYLQDKAEEERAQKLKGKEQEITEKERRLQVINERQRIFDKLSDRNKTEDTIIPKVVEIKKKKSWRERLADFLERI